MYSVNQKLLSKSVGLQLYNRRRPDAASQKRLTNWPSDCVGLANCRSKAITIRYAFLHGVALTGDVASRCVSRNWMTDDSQTAVDTAIVLARWMTLWIVGMSSRRFCNHFSIRVLCLMFEEIFSCSTLIASISLFAIVSCANSAMWFQGRCFHEHCRIWVRMHSQLYCSVRVNSTKAPH